MIPHVQSRHISIQFNQQSRLQLARDSSNSPILSVDLILTNVIKEFATKCQENKLHANIRSGKNANRLLWSRAVTTLFSTSCRRQTTPLDNESQYVPVSVATEPKTIRKHCCFTSLLQILDIYRRKKQRKT